ncbi:MAG: hypothetical protein ABI542_10335 [Gemmatimonadota bacterium]
MLFRLCASFAAAAMLASTSVGLNAQAVVQATVPLMVEGNRPFVQVSFHKSDGSVRTARFLLDTGGGGFLMAEPLARDLGLQWGQTVHEEGAEFGVITGPVAAYLGDFRLDLNPQRTLVVVGQDNILPPAAPGRAEGMIPGHVLSQYDVVFDYPKGSFTIARPDVLTHLGVVMSMPVGTRSGFPRTEIAVDGTVYGLLLDTGASYTMVSEVVLKALGQRHPDWPRHTGAFGDAATLGGQAMETLLLPGAQWGSEHLSGFGVVSQREGTFERWMSGMMASPIVGSLAGNVLKSFRVELDYAHERLYLSGVAMGSGPAPPSSGER